MKDILGKLFSSEHLVKVMRLFLLNQDAQFEQKDISKRTKVNKDLLQVEMNLLKNVGFIEQKSFTKTTADGKKKRVRGWQINKKFSLIKQLYSLLFNAEPVEDPEIVNRFKDTGKLKLMVLAGVFAHDTTGRVDMLIVGDNLNRKQIERALGGIEAEKVKTMIEETEKKPLDQYKDEDIKERFFRKGKEKKLDPIQIKNMWEKYLSENMRFIRNDFSQKAKLRGVPTHKIGRLWEKYREGLEKNDGY